jgi:hypothetical protein
MTGRKRRLTFGKGKKEGSLLVVGSQTKNKIFVLLFCKGKTDEKG